MSATEDAIKDTMGIALWKIVDSTATSAHRRASVSLATTDWLLFWICIVGGSSEFVALYSYWIELVGAAQYSAALATSVSWLRTLRLPWPVSGQTRERGERNVVKDCIC